MAAARTALQNQKSIRQGLYLAPMRNLWARGLLDQKQGSGSNSASDKQSAANTTTITTTAAFASAGRGRIKHRHHLSRTDLHRATVIIDDFGGACIDAN